MVHTNNVVANDLSSTSKQDTIKELNHPVAGVLTNIDRSLTFALYI